MDEELRRELREAVARLVGGVFTFDEVLAELQVYADRRRDAAHVDGQRRAWAAVSRRLAQATEACYDPSTLRLRT